MRGGGCWAGLAGWPDPGCSQLRMRWQEAVRCGGGEKGRKDVSTEFSDDDNSYFMERRYVFKTLGWWQLHLPPVLDEYAEVSSSLSSSQ